MTSWRTYFVGTGKYYDISTLAFHFDQHVSDSSYPTGYSNAVLVRVPMRTE
jgi:hypothetical protein